MERLYKRKTLRMIYVFSKMKDKKLESLRKVKAFYAQKMRDKVLLALRQNADDCLTKDSNMKKALQFQLLRHGRFYLTRRAFTCLKRWPVLRSEKRITRNNLIRAFRLRRFFRNFHQAVNEDVQTEA
jgi:hypothetical protein